MSNIKLYKGMSSLLFIAPSIVSIKCSNNIYWKISCSTIVIYSFLCNAYEYESKYLLLDYINIYSISVSYINNFYLNSLLTLLLVIECNIQKKLNIMHNIAFIVALYKSCKNTYIYNLYYYNSLLCFSTIGSSIYLIRLHYVNNEYINLLLTIIWHICITNILCVSSLTI